MTAKTKRITIGIIAAVVLLLLILYMGGGLTFGQIGPEDTAAGKKDVQEPEHTGVAERTTVTEWYEAVGALEADVRTRVEARIIGRIVDVAVSPGDVVSEGDLLVALDAR